MGNCANKPATTEGEVPVAEEKVAETTEREIVLETKVIHDDDVTTPRSLAQMLEWRSQEILVSGAGNFLGGANYKSYKDEEKKPEVEAAKPAEPSTAAVEPVKAESSETKPAEVVAAPAKVEAPAPEKKAEEKK
ncbi:hypothetical protein RND81_13G209200 [Saponaria officinalis]|uniref:Uncharacterized protein n=1 Tax=Saponaria officinalis TaxID=3572 RepID=A0AAW1H5D1_SAPOF